jgi:hypothetical protein
MDVHITRINCLTGGHPTAAMLPLDYPDRPRGARHALPTIGLVDPPDAADVDPQHAGRGRLLAPSWSASIA